MEVTDESYPRVGSGGIIDVDAIRCDRVYFMGQGSYLLKAYFRCVFSSFSDLLCSHLVVRLSFLAFFAILTIRPRIAFVVFCVDSVPNDDIFLELYFFLCTHSL